MALLTFRDTIRIISPPWLQRGTAERVLYAIAIHCDALVDAVTAAVKMRFPGLSTVQSLALLGRDRRIRRGRTETDSVYASRLMRWLDDHRRRGGPYALLAQLHAHYAPANFPIELVYYSGRRFSMDALGDVERDDIAWTPDAEAARWARWWLFYRWPSPIASDGVWDDPGTWDPDPPTPLGVWDSDLTVQDVADLRAVPKEWNAAHPIGQLVLLAEGAELWDYPPGIWDDPGDWNEAGAVQLGIG